MKSLFWMKQIQGSVRVKINEYVRSWSEFLCVSFVLTFNFFPKINHFFTILRLYMACKMWKITALTWEISSWRLVEKFHISAFYVLFSILLDCGAWNYKTKEKNVCFESRKKDTKTSTKRHEWNGMAQNGLFMPFPLVETIYYVVTGLWFPSSFTGWWKNMDTKLIWSKIG